MRRGLPYSVVEALADAIGSRQELAQAVGMPASTLARRKRAGRLTPAESDRTVRIARVVDMSHALMRGDFDAARRWLTTPHGLLDGESPLQRASTEAGACDVEPTRWPPPTRGVRLARPFRVFDRREVGQPAISAKSRSRMGRGLAER